MSSGDDIEDEENIDFRTRMIELNASNGNLEILKKIDKYFKIDVLLAAMYNARKGF